ncbi:MAG: DUF6796 family protein [Saprospiraceae bacterium]
MAKPLSVSTLLLIGMSATIIVGAGEYMLHYIPEGPKGEISMLENVPLKRASIGHFLVVFGAPFYFAGYYGLMKLFMANNSLLAGLLFITGVLSFSIGGVWVSSRYFAAEVLQKSSGTPDFSFYLQSYEYHYQVLIWALRILIGIVSVIFVILILTNQQGLNKWLAIANPIVLLALIMSLLILFKPLGIHVVPSAMNVAHFIFFGLLLLQLKR